MCFFTKLKKKKKDPNQTSSLRSVNLEKLCIRWFHNLDWEHFDFY